MYRVLNVFTAQQSAAATVIQDIRANVNINLHTARAGGAG